MVENILNDLDPENVEESARLLSALHLVTKVCQPANQGEEEFDVCVQQNERSSIHPDNIVLNTINLLLFCVYTLGFLYNVLTTLQCFDPFVDTGR